MIFWLNFKNSYSSYTFSLQVPWDFENNNVLSSPLSKKLKEFLGSYFLELIKAKKIDVLVSFKLIE